ncbi:MAG: BolA/IbaG family iron-sulfur metabolism protein [Myxococcota bacterium]|nr:BolA/IbaG family iron-sulfur metabolism protein [Myxococcota bacterium]
MDIREEIIKRIRAAYPDAQIELVDMTGTADHWQATIVSSRFEGVGRLARQRGIYAALGELMAGPIHALTFKTLTPEQHKEEM